MLPPVRPSHVPETPIPTLANDIMYAAFRAVQKSSHIASNGVVMLLYLVAIVLNVMVIIKSVVMFHSICSCVVPYDMG
jgi:hypothetical protein